jgi:nicotinic acid mononucleotide adenylyltransferase
MSEQLNLTTPITSPTRTAYLIQRVVLDIQNSVIQCWLIGSDNAQVLLEWDGTQAAALLSALNTANFSTNSLVKNIFLQAISSGKLPPGAVSGVPS